MIPLMGVRSGVESCDGCCDKKLPVTDISHKSDDSDFQRIGMSIRFYLQKNTLPHFPSLLNSRCSGNIVAIVVRRSQNQCRKS
jgi:hypothetical protein